MTLASAKQPPSRRARNKEDKLRRIRKAALELFLSKGFDDTTTREIAARADVGLGTLFLYAENKRDLLFLVANEDLDQTVAAAARAVKFGRSMQSNVLAIVHHHYTFFAKQPTLARLTLREMDFYASGIQGKRFLQIRERLIHLFRDVVADGIKQGTIKRAADAGFVGMMIFALFQIDVRRFLAEPNQTVDDGVKVFARQLRLLLAGIAAGQANRSKT